MRADYDASRLALFHPGQATDFFKRGPAPNEAALAAELSRLVYSHDSERIRHTLAGVGLGRVTFFASDRWDGPGTQALLAEGEAVAVLAFRGTEGSDVRDLLADIDVRPARWSAGGRVHRGFARALLGVWPQIEPRLAALGAARLTITGHSLGGALATLAASLFPTGRLYAFGTPRVGDATFAAGFSAAAARRIVNCCDVVCRLPPARLVPWFRFEHAGPAWYLDREGRLHMTIAAAAIAEDRRLARAEFRRVYSWRGGNVGWRDLADHAPVNYVNPLYDLGAAPPAGAPVVAPSSPEQ